MNILDFIKGMFGATIGSSIGTSGAIKGAEIGATQGIQATTRYTFGNLSKGVAGAVGYAALGKQGLQIGVTKGIGGIPQMIGISAQKTEQAAEAVILTPIIIIVIIVLVLIIGKE